LEAELERNRALAKRILLVTGVLPWEMLGIIAKLKARMDTERGHSANAKLRDDDERAARGPEH
jgi:hypothetical protein